jgi:hypothetical protein
LYDLTFLTMLSMVTVPVCPITYKAEMLRISVWE